MKTGNTGPHPRGPVSRCGASMEPGHEDREYRGVPRIAFSAIMPQWSPAMKTGNT